MPNNDERETIDTMADRVGKALGREMGGRFNVLANLRKEAEAGSAMRTISIVDRWAEPDFVLTIAEKGQTLADRIRGIIAVGTGNKAMDDALALAKLKDISQLLDREQADAAG